ncbi:MAG: AMP-binding protein [Opitutaceae bacterium]|nr:AMP-binding protein [Cytophagales bacterium]
MEEPTLLDFSDEKFINHLKNPEFIPDDKSFLFSALSFAKKWYNDETEFEFSTSGSTGNPKNNLFNKNQIISSVENTAKYFNLQKGDNIFICLNALYTGGKMMMARAIHLKLKAYIVPPTNLPFTQANNNFYKLTAIVPSQLYSILNTSGYENYLKQFENVLIGGASVNAELRSKCRSINYSHVYETFGMTETLSHIALKKISNVYTNQPFEALPGIEVDSDENNCLRIRSEVTNNHWIETKDVVEMVNDNTFIWRGRFDNIINSGGIKINPEEIESVISLTLKSHGVKSFYITSEPNSKFGQKLILVIEGEESSESLLKVLKDILPEHHAPGKILYQKEFNRTLSGKIIRTIQKNI